MGLVMRTVSCLCRVIEQALLPFRVVKHTYWSFQIFPDVCFSVFSSLLLSSRGTAFERWLWLRWKSHAILQTCVSIRIVMSRIFVHALFTWRLFRSSSSVECQNPSECIETAAWDTESNFCTANAAIYPHYSPSDRAKAGQIQKCHHNRKTFIRAMALCGRQSNLHASV